eukprot:TRINITY_DN1625_c0_g1_i1.p1 TRINITY_DN1625_c0_g1~~TRINITY_DN1625_c0_g1_i1.p1  ORF type:complete len:356 (-),score=39.20 TRINITY_DN1625_c0_g1_i1:120-1187(-)
MSMLMTIGRTVGWPVLLLLLLGLSAVSVSGAVHGGTVEFQGDMPSETHEGGTGGTGVWAKDEVDCLEGEVEVEEEEESLEVHLAGDGDRLLIQLLGIEGSGHHLLNHMLDVLSKESNGVMKIFSGQNLNDLMKQRGSKSIFQKLSEDPVTKIYWISPSYPAGKRHWIPNATHYMEQAQRAGFNYLGLHMDRNPIMSIASALRRFNWPISSYLKVVDRSLQMLDSLCLGHERNESPWRPQGSVPYTDYVVTRFDALGSVEEQDHIANALFSHLSPYVPNLRRDQVLSSVHNAFKPSIKVASFDKEPPSVQKEMVDAESQRALESITERFGPGSEACFVRWSNHAAALDSRGIQTGD